MPAGLSLFSFFPFFRPSRKYFRSSDASYVDVSGHLRTGSPPLHFGFRHSILECVLVLVLSASPFAVGASLYEHLLVLGFLLPASFF